MRRWLITGLLVLLALAVAGAGGYYLNEYWISRYDELIERQAGVYGLDPKLVWSLIYEETYFRPSVVGDAEEVGLMQVTPTVARAWAKETGLREFEKQSEQNVQELLRDPERNIQIGSWYLESLRTKYRGNAAEKAMMLAAYNAGPSRVENWTEDVAEVPALSEREFIERIAIPSTKAYVTSILERHRTYPKRLRKIDPETQQETPSGK